MLSVLKKVHFIIHHHCFTNRRHFSDFFLFSSCPPENPINRSLLSRCGGSLISRRHVVTAGHCVARASPRQVHVTLGDYVINSAVEPLPAYTFGVRKIDVHPYFKFTPQADRFDVSVLTLERPVHYMPHIGILRLSTLLILIFKHIHIFQKNSLQLQFVYQIRTKTF